MSNEVPENFNNSIFTIENIKNKKIYDNKRQISSMIDKSFEIIQNNDNEDNDHSIRLSLILDKSFEYIQNNEISINFNDSIFSIENPKDNKDNSNGMSIKSILNKNIKEKPIQVNTDELNIIKNNYYIYNNSPFAKNKQKKSFLKLFNINFKLKNNNITNNYKKKNNNLVKIIKNKFMHSINKKLF